MAFSDWSIPLHIYIYIYVHVRMNLRQFDQSVVVTFAQDICVKR
jgi:hypothetical protein